MKTIFYLDKQSHISSCFDNIEMFSMRFHSALFEMKKRSGCGNFEKHGAYANQLANTSSLENLKGKNFTETDGVYEVPNNGKITLLSDTFTNAFSLDTNSDTALYFPKKFFLSP